ATSCAAYLRLSKNAKSSEPALRSDFTSAIIRAPSSSRIRTAPIFSAMSRSAKGPARSKNLDGAWPAPSAQKSCRHIDARRPARREELPNLRAWASIFGFVASSQLGVCSLSLVSCFHRYINDAGDVGGVFLDLFNYGLVALCTRLLFGL